MLWLMVVIFLYQLNTIVRSHRHRFKWSSSSVSLKRLSQLWSEKKHLFHHMKTGPGLRSRSPVGPKWHHPGPGFFGGSNKWHHPGPGFLGGGHKWHHPGPGFFGGSNKWHRTGPVLETGFLLFNKKISYFLIKEFAQEFARFPTF